MNMKKLEKVKVVSKEKLMMKNTKKWKKKFKHYKKEYINNYYEINIDISKLSPSKLKLLQKILNKRY